MNRDEKIRELETQVRSLASDLTRSQTQLLQLFEELKVLRSETEDAASHPAATAMAAVQQPATTAVHSGLENFIGLRLIHLVGIIVLLTGIAIGIKYAIDKELISPVARIGLAYLAGLVLFVFSLRLKKQYNFFSAILFSGSMACCYFTTYGALAYYQFITPEVAFVVMIALTVFTVYQSIRYNRIEIAVIGLVGAYAIPFLVSNNSSRADLFFSYVLLIDVAVVFLSIRKNWKAVSLLAMALTWLFLFGWIGFDNHPAKQAVGLPFSVLFYFIFLVDCLYSKIRTKAAASVNTLQLVTGNALVYLALLVLYEDRDGLWTLITGVMAFYSALGVALVYALLREDRKLQIILAIQALVLVVLYIAMQWDGVAVTLLWISLSVVLFVWGVMNKRSWARVCAAMLMALTLGKLLSFDVIRFTAVQRIISFIIIGVLLLLGSFYYQRFNARGNS